YHRKQRAVCRKHSIHCQQHLGVGTRARDTTPRLDEGRETTRGEERARRGGNHRPRR
ncbi:hypothetical protein KUCAC02_037578, partial [Chaenocephalus aceratus]